MTEVVKVTPSPYRLADRFTALGPPMLLTGVQAIARLLVEHRALDRRRGLRTASFVSGYQGSPLGGLDRMLSDMPDVLDQNDVRFVPGLNEELAATAVWGSQVDLGKNRYDGVTGFWYGKGPGLDRATDALRHANMYGVHPHGGALLLVGDDPASKSSTVPAVSERTLAALGIPVLFPRNAAEIVTLGLHGIEMSRASGCVVALKIVADVADGAWVVGREAASISPVIPQIEWDGAAFEYRQRPMVLRSEAIVLAEADLVGPRMEIVRQYSMLNALNVIDVPTATATMGLIAAGSCYDSMRQAIVDLGLGEDDLERAGIRVLRLGMMSPVDPRIIEGFAEGLERLLIVEDKTSFVEAQVREILYGRPAAPEILGKRDHNGTRLIPADGELTSGRLLAPMRRVLEGRVDVIAAAPARTPLPMLSLSRSAYFCSGCPHNRSTAIPDGSMGAGGIGCHAMVTVSDRKDSAVTGLTQMGGEGAQWIGQAGFTDANHVFQNVGDGTFFHSAQLALQACVAAGVNITYKILYNDVVAMTGAQDAEGALTVPQLTHKLYTEGVTKIIVCAEEPKRHRRRDLAPGTLLWERGRLDEAQRMLRDLPGVTVLIFDQHCAADARRQRKRGDLPLKTRRVIINEAVCEGCGDCGVKSNCLSVQPVDTEYGRKTRIDQTSCNTDYTCLDGDCPSFVTIETNRPTRLGRTAAVTRRETSKAFPEPPNFAPSPHEGPTTSRTQNVFMVGIGGTGIVTVNQVLATAALRAGYEVESLDQTGLSQKAGPVVGHLRFARGKIEPANRLTPGSADCILGFDLLTLAEDRNLALGDPTSTRTVTSTGRTATGAMVYDPGAIHPDESTLLERVQSASADVMSFDALEAANRIFGNSMAANFLLVGAAYQAGALRVPAAAIEEAIGINGTSVASNVAAFRWGRAAVAAPDAFRTVNDIQAEKVELTVPSSVHQSGLEGEVLRLVSLRAAELVEYQDESVAERYVAVVAQVATAERALISGTRLGEAVARNLFRLTAYKDEYEVARLLTKPSFTRVANEAFPDATVSYMLHPPVLRVLGLKGKIKVGPRAHILLRCLARMKFLRGTWADPFGRAQLRRIERDLRDHYRALVTELAETLTLDTYDRAVYLAELPDLVRGYESVKLRSLDQYATALRDSNVEPPPRLHRATS